MEAPLRIEAILSRPAILFGEEPAEPIHALVKILPSKGTVARARLDFTFLLDASASMYHFKLTEAQRSHWLAVARARQDVSEQVVDGRTAAVWSGQTLRELGEQVSTPMHCALRGLWRGIASLQADDPVTVIAFADQSVTILEDRGQPTREERLPAARAALERLTSGASQAGMGHNTRLAQALEVTVAKSEGREANDVIRRAVLVSDGQILDRDVCDPLLERATDADLVISAIGVGDDFDEEFLMHVADETRGRYYYAPTARDLEVALAAEFASMRQGVARRASLTVEPASDTVLRGVYQVRPEIARFPVTWVTEHGSTQRLGNVAHGCGMEFLVALGPPAREEGSAPLVKIRLAGEPIGDGPAFEAVTELELLATSEPALARARDDQVMDVVMRLDAFLEERRAQAAKERGDAAGATRHLKAATRIIRHLGEAGLAAEMEAEANAVTGQSEGRTKRIKVGTRRLGQTRPLG